MNNPQLFDEIERKILSAGYRTGSQLDARILDDAISQLKTDADQSPVPSIWRRILASHWARYAAMAATIVVVAAAISVLLTSPRQAFALQDTRAAMQAVRSIHVRTDPAGEGFAEAWAVFTEDHRLLQLRMDFPNTQDGAKVTIWQKDKAVIWLKTKGNVITVQEKSVLDRVPELFGVIDPQPMVEALMNAQARQAAEVVIEQPSEKDKPVVITHSQPDAVVVFYIDARTHLVHRIEKYEPQAANAGNRKLLARVDYSDFGAVDPKVFTLDLPKGTDPIDMTGAVGLEQGDLSEEQIAQKLSHDFCQALVDRDWTRLGALVGGVGVDRAKQWFGDEHYVRLISVGQPRPDPNHQPHTYRVPCEMEITRDGKSETIKFETALRPVYGQPTRWAIGGLVR